MASDAQKKAISTYWKQFDQIRIRVTKEQKQRYMDEAKKKGKSLTRFVIDCIENYIQEGD